MPETNEKPIFTIMGNTLIANNKKKIDEDFIAVYALKVSNYISRTMRRNLYEECCRALREFNESCANVDAVRLDAVADIKLVRVSVLEKEE